MTTRTPVTAAVLAAVALIGAGCGGSAASDAETTSAKPVSAQDKAVKLADCIRAHGVPHFPDPDAKGEFEFGIDVSPAVWKRAVDACKAFAAPGEFSGKRTLKQQSAALRFAACVRAHGIKDFPDPANGEPLIDTTRIPSSDAPGGMALLNAATEKCHTVLGQAMGGQG